MLFLLIASNTALLTTYERPLCLIKNIPPSALEKDIFCYTPDWDYHINFRTWDESHLKMSGHVIAMEIPANTF
jgi:hypothetical protein